MQPPRSPQHLRQLTATRPDLHARATIIGRGRTPEINRLDIKPDPRSSQVVYTGIPGFGQCRGNKH